MSQSGPNLGPSWLQVGSSLGQVGPSWLQVGSSWPMLAPSWLPLKTIHAVACPTSQNPPRSSMPRLKLAPCWHHVGSMLAYVGPSGLQDGPTWLQVGPSWPQDAIMLAQVGLKMPKMAFNSQLGSIFDQTLLILERLGSSKY